MEVLDSNRRNERRYRMHNGLIVGISKHAAKRAEQRGIDIALRLQSLQGVPLKEYKRRGVVARYQASVNFMKIITVW